MDIQQIKNINFKPGITQAFKFNAIHGCKFKDNNHIDNKKVMKTFKVILIYDCDALNDEDVVVDFRKIEAIVKDLEGKDLNEYFGEAVTTEYLARFFAETSSEVFYSEVFRLELEEKIDKEKLLNSDLETKVNFLISEKLKENDAVNSAFFYKQKSKKPNLL